MRKSNQILSNYKLRNQSSSSLVPPKRLNKMAISIPCTMVGTAVSMGQFRENPTLPDFCTFFMQLLNFSWHPTLIKPFFSTHLSWILQQASRSSHGFSPGQPDHPTPQYFPYRIPTELQFSAMQVLLHFTLESLVTESAKPVRKTKTKANIATTRVRAGIAAPDGILSPIRRSIQVSFLPRVDLLIQVVITILSNIVLLSSTVKPRNDTRK